MEKFISDFAKIPGPQKALGTFFAAFLILAGGYYFMISDTLLVIDEVTEQNAVLTTKESGLEEKARNLKEYKKEIGRLQVRLLEAQNQLPKKSEIPKLLRDIDFEAQQSGLRILRFDVQKEKKRKDRADIPLKMKVKGSYHELAVFFDRVSKMDRIVNVSDIDISKPTFENKKIVLTSSFLATTYRFIEKKSKKKKK